MRTRQLHESQNIDMQQHDSKLGIYQPCASYGKCHIWRPRSARAQETQKEANRPVSPPVLRVLECVISALKVETRDTV